MKNPRILITGSTGNVGKLLSSYLIEKDYNVLGLTIDKIVSDREIGGSLNDYESLVKATKNIKIVIHLAAAIKGNNRLLKRVNVEGTENLVKACEKNNVKKIIFISSLDTKFKTSYGISKIKAEEIIKKSKLRYTILRPCTIYGENFKTGINSLVKILKRTYLMPIFGSGNNLYQPLYVYDIISIIKQIIDKNKFNNKIYFIGGKDRICMNYLVDRIAFYLNKKIIKIHLPETLEKIFLKTQNFKYNKICDNGEIKKDFDFNPTSIEAGLKKII